MLALTHIVVSLLLMQVMMLDRNDAFLAFMFGVFIDVDHFLGLATYAQDNGVQPLTDLSTLLNPGGQWKSMLHSPLALGIVIPVSFAARLAIPFIFWGVHVAMDFAEQNYLGNFSGLEALLLTLTTFALISLRYSKFMDSGSTLDSIWAYFKSEFGFLKRAFRPTPKSTF